MFLNTIFYIHRCDDWSLQNENWDGSLDVIERCHMKQSCLLIRCIDASLYGKKTAIDMMRYNIRDSIGIGGWIDSKMES